MRYSLDDESRVEHDRQNRTYFRLRPAIAAPISSNLNIRSNRRICVWYARERSGVNIVLIAIPRAADIRLVSHCLRKFRKLLRRTCSRTLLFMKIKSTQPDYFGSCVLFVPVVTYSDIRYYAAAAPNSVLRRAYLPGPSSPMSVRSVMIYSSTWGTFSWLEPRFAIRHSGTGDKGVRLVTTLSLSSSYVVGIAASAVSPPSLR